MLHICRELFTTRMICRIACQSIYHPCLAHDTSPHINCHFVAMVTLPSGAPQRYEPAIWATNSDFFPFRTRQKNDRKEGKAGKKE
ncbi:hypothetical protein CEXT_348651 [Caerostris extrusa]|uniref:Secreted protein n=1 Tax=Caerostris extrusa TaxID=172846 RepID=A0AAV4XV76_CAEEX|nr:hypothetical protein CEXT_348651 [Caerostris extrusa]